MKSGRLLDRQFVGETPLNRNQMEKICRKVDQKFVFDRYDNNCQNYVEACLQEIGLSCPISPLNERSAVHVVQLASDVVDDISNQHR